MGTYFNEHPKKQRWESSQAILHRKDSQATLHQEGSQQKEKNQDTIKNSYGQLNYLKKDKKRGQEREGFSLEAFEAPGTPLHTEKEKHLDTSSMKKIKQNGKQTLFASEVPLHNQAIFYDMADSKRSSRFLKYMKHLIHTRGHQTLQDTLGFLDQESERKELDLIKKEPREYSPEEFDWNNKRMDTLHSQILRKESKERQLCKELQLMLDQHTKEDSRNAGQSRQNQTPPENKERKHSEPFLQRRLHSSTEDIPASMENPQEDGMEDFPASMENPQEDSMEDAKVSAADAPEILAEETNRQM